MKTIKVLHVIRPAEGGMKGHLISLAEGLKQRGYTVEVACPGDSSLAEEISNLGLLVHPIDLVGPLNPGSDWRCVTQLRSIIRRGSYDLVHFHGAKAGLVGRIAAVTAGCARTVVTVHNFIIYDEVPLAKRIVFKNGEKLLSRVTSRIITVSKALKDDLTENYRIDPAKIVPVYNGIDVSRYYHVQNGIHKRDGWAHGIGSGVSVVGTVARMAPQKGLSYLIEAMAEINRLYPDTASQIKCVIAGDGPLLPELKKQVQTLGVETQVLFPGFVDDIPGFFACLDVFVTPSIAEGLSITTIEAMAAGLPVVATRVGGLPELIRDGETGRLVESRDPGAMARAVMELLADKEKGKMLGANARNFALDSFSTEAMINNTCAVYAEVLAGSAGHAAG